MLWSQEVQVLVSDRYLAKQMEYFSKLDGTKKLQAQEEAIQIRDKKSEASS